LFFPVKLPDAVAQMGRATALQARDESTERRAMAHEIKLDGYRMAASIEDGRVKLLTRSCHDWTAKVITETSKLDIRTGPRSVTPLNFRLTAPLKLSWRTVGAVATTAFSAGTDDLK
jgi:hypothetical protein